MSTKYELWTIFADNRIMRCFDGAETSCQMWLDLETGDIFISIDYADTMCPIPKKLVKAAVKGLNADGHLDFECLTVPDDYPTQHWRAISSVGY